VLIFEEADSVLSSRSSAKAHWEIVLVNELLSQLDTYQGLVIFTTNRLSEFDTATFRRFDLTVQFTWLTTDQAQLMLETISKLPLTANDLLLARLKKLEHLTPGDFVAAHRKRQLLAAKWSLADWITSLETQSRDKASIASHLANNA